MGEYTYLVGLAILGVFGLVTGMVAARAERRTHRGEKRGPSHSDAPAHAR
jgi:hypothetical protein